jgi:hypothetical protein
MRDRYVSAIATGPTGCLHQTGSATTQSHRYPSLGAAAGESADARSDPNGTMLPDAAGGLPDVARG